MAEQPSGYVRQEGSGVGLVEGQVTGVGLGYGHVSGPGEVLSQGGGASIRRKNNRYTKKRGFVG